MILSFHPMIIADENRICAGRDPDDRELAAIRRASAVILPQGCRQPLHDMAVRHCAHVFPDYSAKFAYPGKTGQAALFAHLALPHPETETFASVDEFYAGLGITDNASYSNSKSEMISRRRGLRRRRRTVSTLRSRRRAGEDSALIWDWNYPLVFKFDWGGQGDTVMRIDSPDGLEGALDKAKSYEKTGQSGFLIQDYIPCGNRSLRVAVIGRQRIAYWRIQQNPDEFGTALSKGAEINENADPEKKAAGIAVVDRLCEKTGINLAGVDLIFPENPENGGPLLLEINYFFGRTGLGGSGRFYSMLRREVKHWIKDLKRV